MKNFLKTVIFLIVMKIVSHACSDMNELHDKYLKDGEKTYIAKLDTVGVQGGKNRVRIVYRVIDPKAEKMRLFYNFGADSITYDIIFSSAGELNELYLNNISEGTHSFTLYTYDAQFKNKSVIINAPSVIVYGDKYQETLMNRLVRNAVYNSYEDTLTISWLGNFEYNINFELKYTNNFGETVEIMRDAKEVITKLGDYVPESRFDFRLLYLPESSIDTFYTEYSSHVAPMPLPIVTAYENFIGMLDPLMMRGSNINLIEQVWLGQYEGVVEKQLTIPWS